MEFPNCRIFFTQHENPPWRQPQGAPHRGAGGLDEGDVNGPLGGQPELPLVGPRGRGAEEAGGGRSLLKKFLSQAWTQKPPASTTLRKERRDSANPPAKRRGSDIKKHTQI